MNLLTEKIDELIRVEGSQHPEQLVSFFARVQSNYDEAIRTASRFFLIMLATWVLTCAMYWGWIDDFRFQGLALNPKMIIASPFLVGILTYRLLSAMAAAVVLWEVVSEGVFRMLPTTRKYGFDDLLAPPTFSNVERMLEPRGVWPSRFSRFWFGLVTIMMFLGSLAALVTTTWFLFRPRVYDFFQNHHTIYVVIAAVSAILGWIAWVRGFVLFRYAIERTGWSTKFRHHREPERAGVLEGPSVEKSGSPTQTPEA